MFHCGSIEKCKFLEGNQRRAGQALRRWEKFTRRPRGRAVDKRPIESSSRDKAAVSSLANPEIEATWPG